MILPPFLLARWVREQPRRKTGKQTDVIQNAPASTIRNLLRWSTSMVDCTRDVEEQWLLQWSDSRGWRMHKEGHPKRDHSGELWKGGSEPMQVSSLSESDDNHREAWRKNGTVIEQNQTWNIMPWKTPASQEALLGGAGGMCFELLHIFEQPLPHFQDGYHTMWRNKTIDQSGLVIARHEASSIVPRSCSNCASFEIVLWIWHVPENRRISASWDGLPKST